MSWRKIDNYCYCGGDVKRFKPGQKVYVCEDCYVREYTVTQEGSGFVGVIRNDQEDFLSEGEVFATRRCAVLAKANDIVGEIHEHAGIIKRLSVELAKYSAMAAKLETPEEKEKAEKEIDQLLRHSQALKNTKEFLSKPRGDNDGD